MSNWSDYQREEAPRLEAGDYRVEIVAVEEKESRNGNPMIVITVRPNGTSVRINHYIVKNEYFNRNMTEFFDSFNVEEGNFNFPTWIGAVGAARLKEDGQYMRVGWFIRKSKAESLPPWQGPLPERQTVTDGFTDADDEPLPF